MSDIAVRAEGISKQYVRGPELGWSVRRRIGRALTSPWRRLRGVAEPRGPTYAREPFWALKDVSFEVAPGERLGIIGRNGAGKSTLLKILSRVAYPTEGQALIRGRVTSLLEVGTGFSMALTGRENIYLNASVHGLSRAEVDRRLDQIVEFSGVGKFLDTPVKHYSSGMYLRLAFSVVAHLDPDILLLDEVLAVGDLVFQEKCLGRVAELTSGQGRTILYVSHNLASVASLCTRVMWLDQGKVRYLGDPEAGIDAYYKDVTSSATGSLMQRYDRLGTGELRFTNVWFADESAQPCKTVGAGQTFRIVLEYEFTERFWTPRDVVVSVVFMNDKGHRVFGCPSDALRTDLTSLLPKGSLVCVVRDVPLQVGTYDLLVGCRIDHRLVDKVPNAARLVVVEADFYGTGRLPHPINGSVLVGYEWRVGEEK